MKLLLTFITILWNHIINLGTAAMKISNNLFLVGTFCLVLSGCSTIQTPKPIISTLGNDVTTFSNTAELSTTIVRQKNSLTQICVQPAPDVTFNSTDSDSLSFSIISTGKSNGDGGAASASEGGNEMNGRTPAVLITRELFYRLCETYTNLNLTKEEALPLFTKILDLVGQGWSAESAKTVVSIGPVNNIPQPVVTTPVVTTPAVTPPTSASTAAPANTANPQ